jgi:hypothetical protein
VIIIFQVRTEARIFQEFFGHCAAQRPVNFRMTF